MVLETETMQHYPAPFDDDGEMLPEIGYHIHKKYWRKGFAKEAANKKSYFEFIDEYIA